VRTIGQLGLLCHAPRQFEPIIAAVSRTGRGRRVPAAAPSVRTTCCAT